MEKETAAQRLREGLRELVRALGVLEKNEAGCCELSLGQCHAVVEIGRAGTLSLIRLAALLDLDKSTVSRMVEKLVQEGMLERRENAADRRYNELCLTQTGKLAYRKVESQMDVYFATVLDKILPEKRALALEGIELLVQAFAEMKKN